ncbi:tyrosine-type recombinase/integrase [Pseudomonas sp. WS 5532]|nr:tyrosine-type recombinase/integrase [Pseudomonas sp. WS 5532]
MTSHSNRIEAFERWLATAFSNPYSRKTCRVYSSVTAAFLGYIDQETGNTFPCPVEPSTIRRFVSRNNETGKAYSKAYQTLRCSALNIFWHWLVETKVMIENPVKVLLNEVKDSAGRPAGGKRPTRLPVVLSWRDQQDLLESVKNTTGSAALRDRALIALALATGLRNEEICTARLSGLDLDYRRLRVVGKGDKERLIIFNHDDAVKTSVLAWLQERQALLAWLEQESDFLFVSRTGRPLTGSLVYQQVTRHIRMAGLDGKVRRRGPHLLRHTAASVMFAKRVPVLQIKENLGHEDLATTQIYAHLLPEPEVAS